MNRRITQMGIPARSLRILGFAILATSLPLAIGCNWGNSGAPSTAPNNSATTDQGAKGETGASGTTSPLASGYQFPPFDQEFKTPQDWLAVSKKQSAAAQAEFDKLSADEQSAAKKDYPTLVPATMEKGDVGTLDKVTVLQVIDGQSMLAEADGQSFVLVGLSTEDRLDGREFKPRDEFVFKVSDYTQYETAIGGTRKVPKLELSEVTRGVRLWRAYKRGEEVERLVEQIGNIGDATASLEWERSARRNGLHDETATDFSILKREPKRKD